MWEANWLNDVNPSLNELTHHGTKGMHWGVRKDQTRTTSRFHIRRERIEKTPEQKAMLKARRKRIVRNTNRTLVIAGTIVAADKMVKYGHVPVKTITKYTVKGTVKISDSKTPAGLAGKLAVNAITTDYWNKTFATLSDELDQVNAMGPEQRSEEIRKTFNNAK